MNKHTYAITINTERLSIAPLSEKDAPFIVELLNTDGWIKYIGDRNIHTKAEAITYIQKIHEKPNINYWTVSLKETPAAIGVVTLIKRDYLDFQDIGFAFLPQYSQKGYAREATKAVLTQLAKQNIIEKILAITLPANKSSIKLLEKLGLKFRETIQQDNEQLHLYAASVQELNQSGA
ncbi:GNAT family N-acetyltransferase [Polluticaenibacter yanchengensis]|uniref:GNAT family N-acetyltransferase n=1 Tax=Polluticaenibacter yanchengensis TaxID=3014562 RepID=A0ABT4UG54_9BACT|nr:GNAT family N-acetyltransferase [Chitinophagaceae bacterium LY-5]